MQKTCANDWCQNSFDVLDADRELLAKFDCPEPDQCPNCRHQQRATFKGEVRLHKRKSDLSNKDIISIYPAATPFPVYAIDEWWGDGWDQYEYGREYDFQRPFFAQFKELFDAIPKMANFNEKCENSEYSTYAGSTKNAYYCHEAYRSENVYYCRKVVAYCENLCDCLRCQKSSYLYECVQCEDCHYSSYLYRCTNSRDCHFCIDCQGCHDCLFCWNLRNQKYHIFNQPVSKEEFEDRKAEYIDGKYSTLQENFRRLAQMYPKVIWKACNNINCEDCHGDALTNCAHCHECYNLVNCEGNRYCIDMSPSEKNVSSMDQTGGGIGELLYNDQGLGGGNYFVRMSALCRGTNDMTYCIYCYQSKHCFGCTSLKSAEYCILNKQYTKEEYDELLPKIIDHMKQTGEWGQFFPPQLSSFAYNVSLAGAIFPLTKEGALQRGWGWEDEPDLQPEGPAHTGDLPDSIDDVDDSICQQVLTCTKTKRQYNIQKQELEFYRILRQPLPRVHPIARMERRLLMLNPYRLWERQCAKCDKQTLSSFAPNRPETVYCEQCYLAEVY